jgi:chromosome segregation ATPase
MYKEVHSMSTGISFWKRVGGALRANANRDDGDGNGVALAIEPVDAARENGGDRGNGASPIASLLPWVRRGRSLKQLDERYQRVVDLMDAMRIHFEKQDCRAEELTTGVDRVGRTLEQLAATQRSQGECVASIAARVEGVAKHSAGLSAMLLKVPASLQAQADAVRAVAREMEAARAADAQLVSSLQQFSQAADSLRNAGTVQVEALQRLHDAGAQQKESLQIFVRQQTRLLLVLTIIVGVLGLGAVAALGVVVRMVFNA